MAGESEAKFRICSSVSEALSYMPCPLQYTEPSNQNELFVFWSQHNDEFPTVFPTTGDTTVYPDTIKERITLALKSAYISDYYACWLVQFWAPVTTNDQIFLTTCDLPFGLTKLHEGLCLYRSECLKCRIPIGTDNSKNENQLGPTGRVFTHGLPEMSPDVSHYSATDYPQLGLALTAGLGNYLAIPVFEPLSNQCTGVLEIIGDKKGSFSQELVQMVYEMLKKVDLRSSIMYDHPDKKGPKGLERALKELEEQLSFICRTHQLPLAQTWLPAPDGSYIERFMTTKEQFCIYTSEGYEFRAACDMFHLGKSQGVVGRAFLSRNSCFCSDITKLCMSEYPLAHVAHKVGFHGSFAICLQSSYTGDYAYLLEFFLPQDNKSDCRSPQTMLNMLLATMKRQFRSFKLASGNKLGEKLFVEVIPVPSDDGQNSFEICQNPKQSSDVEPITRQKILWLDTLNRSLNGGSTVNPRPPSNDVTAETTANTITEVRNVSIQANRVVCTSSEEEIMRNILQGQYRVNSVVLQHAVSEENDQGTTLARLTTQPLSNNCGREHYDLSDISCSSYLLQSTKAADEFLEKTSGNDQSYHHDTAAPLARATSQTMQLSATPRKRSNFLSSDFPAGDPERSPKVSKLFDISSEIKFWQREAAALRQELQTMRESHRHMLGEGLSALAIQDLGSLKNQLEKSLQSIYARKSQIFKDKIEALKRKRFQTICEDGENRNGINTNITNINEDAAREQHEELHLFDAGIALFEMEYSHWVEEQQKKNTELWNALQFPVSITKLELLVENVLSHYYDLFRMKAEAAKVDVFYLMSGMWRTPSEQLFLWLGGFKPSDLINVVMPQLEPLTEQQIIGIGNLRLFCHQAEDALTQGMGEVQQSLSQNILNMTAGAGSYNSRMLSSNLELLAGLIEQICEQADHVRQQTLRQMSQMLRTRQAARGLLAFGEYHQRLRALSSLFAARPR